MANNQSKVPWKSTLFMSKWLTLWKKLLSIKTAHRESSEARRERFQLVRSTCKLTYMGRGWRVFMNTCETVIPCLQIPSVSCTTGLAFGEGKPTVYTSPGNIPHKRGCPFPHLCVEWTPLFKSHLERDAFWKTKSLFSQEETMYWSVCGAHTEGETKSNR